MVKKREFLGLRGFQGIKGNRAKWKKKKWKSGIFFVENDKKVRKMRKLVENSRKWWNSKKKCAAGITIRVETEPGVNPTYDQLKWQFFLVLI